MSLAPPLARKLNPAACWNAASQAALSEAGQDRRSRYCGREDEQAACSWPQAAHRRRCHSQQAGLDVPIRPELRQLYPADWREISARVRFERAGEKCQGCGRPHLGRLRCLPDGRWFDEEAATWRDRRGRPARWPDLVEMTRLRTTRVVLAAAHLDSDPANNRLANSRSLCQRCHMLHDRPYHLAQRWITYRRRYALGDLFLGFYEFCLRDAGGLPPWPKSANRSV